MKRTRLAPSLALGLALSAWLVTPIAAAQSEVSTGQATKTVKFKKPNTERSQATDAMDQAKGTRRAASPSE